MHRLILALTLCACTPTPQAVPTIPPALRHYTAQCIHPSGRCCASCAALAGAHCPEALPTPAGASCEEVCENANASGVLVLPDLSDCTTRVCILSRQVECAQ